MKQTKEGNGRRMSTPAFVGVVVVLGILVIWGAVVFGQSDHGVINVADTINSSNQSNAEAQGDPNNNVQAVPEVFKNMPNGGLVPAENQEKPAEVVPENTEATTTNPEGEADPATEDGDANAEETPATEPAA